MFSAFIKRIGGVIFFANLVVKTNWNRPLNLSQIVIKIHGILVSARQLWYGLYMRIYGPASKEI